MDEVKNKGYLEYMAEKELAEEANIPAAVPKELTKGERLSRSLVHFWSYKKWYVILPLIIVIVVGSLAYSIIKNNTKPFFSMRLVNIEVEDSDLFTKSIDGFNDYLHSNGIAKESKKMTYVDGYRHPLASDEEYVVDYDINSSTQKLSSELTSDLVDVLIVNTRCADEFCDSNAWEPLENILSKEQLEKIDEQYYYYGNVDNKKQIIGIRVEAFSQLSDLQYRPGDTYVITVSGFSSQKEMVKTFFDYMLED